MATIKEIAELAGVSRGTVDRVLNNRGAVCPETEAKIKSIIKELNYKPNRAGIALAAQKKKNTIGIIMFSSNPFFDEVLHGIDDKAEELSIYGCEILIKRVAYHPAAQLSAIKACVKEGIQGLIITPYNDRLIQEELNALSRSGIPVITVNSDAEGVQRLAYVGSDYYQSGLAAASLMSLVSSGDINLGIIIGDSNILCHTQRYAGFVDKLSDEKRFHVAAFEENFDDDTTSYEVVKKMILSHPEINAFYFAAAGVNGGCRAIQELKNDYAHLPIITHDDYQAIQDMMQKNIVTATICQEPYWQGSKSLDVMFSYLSRSETVIEESYFAKLSIKIKEIAK